MAIPVAGVETRPLDMHVPSGRVISGCLTSRVPPPAPAAIGVVVMLHGLFTNKDHDFAQPLGDAICAATGLHVYRFDFTSHRDPAYVFPGYPEDLEDVRRAEAMLRGRGLRVVCVVGHSKGANVALMHAADRSDAGVPIVVLAPRFFMSGMPSSLFSAAELASLDGLGASFSWEPKCGGTITVTRAMLDAVARIDMGDVVRRIPAGVPVLLLHGTKDRTIPVSDADAFVAARPSVEKRVLRTSHIFSDDRSKMVRAVVEFIARHCLGCGNGC